MAEITILDAGVLFILTVAPKAVVPIPIVAVSTAVVNVATPATLTSQESYKSARAQAVKKKVEL